MYSVKVSELWKPLRAKYAINKLIHRPQFRVTKSEFPNSYFVNFRLMLWEGKS